MYITRGQGLWKNLEIYMPGWSEKYLVYTMIFLFVLFLGLYWIFALKNKSKMLRNSQSLMIVLILVLFSFSIYCLADNTTSVEEAFAISTIILGILLYNFITIFNSYDSGLSIMAILPLIIYSYIYTWIYEIKNSY